MAECRERVGPVWKLGGETCQCILDETHVVSPDRAEHWHLCSCRTTWVTKQQIEEGKST